MTTTPQEPLGDDEMTTEDGGGIDGNLSGPRASDAEGADADGTDGSDADGTDGAAL